MIRRATPDDVPALMRLGECARRESLTHFPPIDETKIAAIKDQWFAHPDLCLALIAERNGKPIGMMLAVMSDYVWSGVRVAMIQTAYTVPAERGWGGFLIRRCVTWARENGAVDVRLTLESGIDVPMATALLRRMGFTEMGMGYTKVL